MEARNWHWLQNYLEGFRLGYQLERTTMAGLCGLTLDEYCHLEQGTMRYEYIVDKLEFWINMKDHFEVDREDVKTGQPQMVLQFEQVVEVL